MLQINGLCKSYGKRQVLQPVSFFLPQGSCLGITGGNGAGKSTLLRLIAQTEKPDGGSVLYRGKDVFGDRAFLRRELGYVPQEPGLMEDLTAAQQLKLWYSACGLTGALPEDVLSLLDVAALLKSRIGALSGGMRQRVSITMALLNRPSVLLLDEACSGLDEHYRERFLRYLEDFLAGGGRILLCSHDKDELRRLCGSRIHLRDGQVIPQTKEEQL